MILNSALMSHNAGAISHQNPRSLEAEESAKDKSKGKGLLVFGKKVGRDAMPTYGMCCNVEVCVGGRWVVSRWRT